MKNLLPLGLIAILVSCTKTSDSPIEQIDPISSTEKQTCTFGIQNYNLTKREPLSEEASRKPRNGGGNGNGGGGGTTTPPPPPAPTSGVILLDFDGQTVSNTSWNWNGNIVCSPANMSTEEQSLVFQRVSNDYSPFNVTVTLDETVYNAAPTNRRTRVIITETYEWFGQAGGTAFIGSFADGSSAPCFVFSSLLAYNSRYVAEAASHEAGHTFGLYHQASYSGCSLITDYYSGSGYGETGWAPIMGNAYSQNLSLWHRGPNQLSCSSTQDDLATISSIVGYRADDHVNSFSGATALSSSAIGQINNSSDVDFFVVNNYSTRTLSVVPTNYGPYNSGANTDFVLNVYNSSGSLISSVNDPSVLHAAVSLPAGTYYVSAAAAANNNIGTYGMLGTYSINLY